MGFLKSPRCSTSFILVMLSIFALMELSEGCHRRVEYHHYHKKRPPPPKGHGGHGHKHGGGYTHGGGSYHGPSGGSYHGNRGHGGGGHKGHYGGGNYGHGGDYGGMPYGGGHEGHTGGENHGHGGDYGGMPYGGGHEGHTGGENHGHGGDYGGMPYGGHEGHTGGENHGHGGDYGGMHYGGMPYGAMPYHGGHEGHGNGNGPRGGARGHRFKYQTFESMRYDDDKDNQNHHQPPHGHGYQNQGYSHNTPHYMKKGYGYSSPYPNTEYSHNVETSMNAPEEIDSFDDAYRLDAADTAELIRNSFDPKDNEVMTNSRGNFGDNSGSNSEFRKPDVIVPAPALRVTSSEEGSLKGQGGGGDASEGNFDMNLNFNSPDLPIPFRRNFFDSSLGKRKDTSTRDRRRNRLSSKYRSGQIRESSPKDNDASQTTPQIILKGGSDYLENDAETTGPSASEKTQEILNF